MRIQAIAVIAAWAFSLPLGAQTGPRLADMEPVLARVAAWDPGQPRDPLYEFIDFLRAAMNSKSELPRIEARLLRMLAPDAKTSPAGKDFVCRQLSLIGTGASVPTMARLLRDASMAEMARYALARIPSPAAGAALRNALPHASGKAQAGIVNAVGERRDALAVPALKNLLGSPDAAVFDAALGALAEIGDSQALATIRGVLGTAAGARREPVLRAYARCAGAVAAGGGKAAARAAYRELSAAGEPSMIRIAGLTGLAALDRAAAVPLLEKELGSSDADVQAAAIRLLNGVPGAIVTAIFVQRYAGLTPTGQIRVLTALAERDDVAVARPAVMEGLKSAVPEVRATAIATLGKAGDGSSVALLADLAAGTQGEEQAAARESLALLHGPGVDSAIVSAIASSSGKVQLELIRAAGERASPELAGVLMKIAQGPDRASSQAAIRAVRNAAGPEQAPALLATVLKIQNSNERREAALTLASVMKRAARPEIGPVLAAYESAGDKQTKLTLMDVMGQVSAGEALPVLRAGLKDPDPEIARAAILALTAWMTPDPLPDLLEAARGDTNTTRQILALRGYIKLIGVPAERSAAQSVALLKEVWPLAKQAAEKRAILALLQLYPTPGALQMAESAATDADVAREAKAAVETIRASGVQ
ncbi:MAG: HEAT repeat domain-containing protein [Candidatus Solibacter sp.]|nr:HEAT repeat domain-containing protein [Candidatus Solibacter sp.]